MTCGGGVERRRIYCVREHDDDDDDDDDDSSFEDAVSDDLCSDVKPACSRPCSQQSCPAWFTGAWSPVSYTHYRLV